MGADTIHCLISTNAFSQSSDHTNFTFLRVSCDIGEIREAKF